MNKILGLDVSTKTIGIALFTDQGSHGRLDMLHHINPKVALDKTLEKTHAKLDELIKKADLFKELLEENYTDMDITMVIIEEPLVRSNNINTVSVLLRFNGMICKVVKDVLGITPVFISSYDSRKFAHPDLMDIRRVRKNGDIIPDNKLSTKEVLFGGYPYAIDKKHVIYEKVKEREPNIQWLLNTKGNLKKENYDMCDAYTCVLGHMRKNSLWS